jgi:hypothetical protein
LVCMDQPKHGGLFDPHEDAVRESRNGPYAVGLARETFVTEEFPRAEHGRKNRFLALVRQDRGLQLALLDVINRVDGIALGEDDLVLANPDNGSPIARLGEERR